jgi:hypothetical protein
MLVGGAAIKEKNWKKIEIKKKVELNIKKFI